MRRGYLKRNAEIPLRSLIGVWWGRTDSGAGKQERDRGQAQGRRDQDKGGGGEAIDHLAGLRVSCLQAPGPECQELCVHRIGVQTPDLSVTPELSPEAESQGQAPRTSNLTQQPRLSGKRPPQGCDGEEECRCLLIHGVFYFYKCWPWAGAGRAVDLAIGNNSIEVRRDLGGQALGREAGPALRWCCSRTRLAGQTASWTRRGT